MNIVDICYFATFIYKYKNNIIVGCLRYNIVNRININIAENMI